MRSTAREESRNSDARGIRRVDLATLVAMGKLHDRPELRERRRDLRRNATRAEQLLWSALRGRRTDGTRFRRQHSVGPYVLDFYCPRARLAIELDGSSHDNDAVQRRDAVRDRYLEACKIRVVRILNDEVERNLEGVVAMLLAEAQL